ncbi:adenylyltransferase/cytidyltransferase family protein [Pseudomonas nitroreducens]|uniref:adenylyltransferase/cytidyltransferase family protein n=1 Tax=Pseudomonas nitroreducens TaxID=46680 RepID=UPI00265A68AD|nr:adenylyltransferase/cytidyltransferase family protein [Pseudomonas nitroreducens]MCP1647233.1 glycerol-3-phosphate cytidylyltransferase [Pseudomonas nitroreducens]MCP1685809.1 glycerol-3-phosphate cytidylyltransferase [Pseudomonas nitroreducens]
MKSTVLTYGTFDLFHNGHLKLLERLKSLGDQLIVGVSTDEFNAIKGKKTIIPFKDRIDIVRSIKFVDLAIPETDWDQKSRDIELYDVDILGMGHDWEGKFDNLKSICKVVYLPRTEGISSTKIKSSLSSFDKENIKTIKDSMDVIADIIERLS